MGFCNSCGKPMTRTDELGTNKDGSPNEYYCADCYQNGEFTEPDLTVEDMIVKKAQEMLDKNPDLREGDATGLLINFLPNLKRWNKNYESEFEHFNKKEKKGYRNK
ncbi:hypothetical protein BGI41_00915 [Methanobrevibacter sp. 87.7]|uniref:zinc ribbon domain-containing protein n=1 Tax=Methanobrevibacter sp. 87.7 TaxID=387957 RepID=UPI000B510DFB|nr:zinc ribbon domain-containing protein [Methanobrevibacter sp. 87.7]OWT33720.1 hypothetical protein BGI41_00915 [Methanobrevibacter sp. 87.7]